MNDSSPQGGSNEAEGVVFKVSFLLNIKKDCHLFLKQSTGMLDYVSLPLHNADCSIQFPSTEADDDSKEEGVEKGSLSPAVRHPGLLVQLTRLNVPCDSGGYIKFSENAALCGKLEELRLSERTYHFNMHKNTSVRIHKNPMFSLKFQLVDFCYNMSLTEQNGSFYLHPTKDSLECYFHIHLPYGNRVELTLVVNNRSIIAENLGANENLNSDRSRPGRPNKSNLQASANGGSKNDVVVFEDESMLTHTDISLSGTGGRNASRNSSSSDFFSSRFPIGDENAPMLCNGLRIQILEFPTYKWSYCADEHSGTRRFSLISQGNTIVLHVVKVLNGDGNLDVSHMGSGPKSISEQDAARASSKAVQPGDGGSDGGTDAPTLFLAYTAKPIPEIVSECAFGWVAMQQFCVTTVDMAVSWHQGEEYCVDRGGHLASIRCEADQKTIDQLLLNSPGYQDRFAYWVGASDKTYEGDFRWNDGLPFSYTNWFPGWTQHGLYNRQPNDDGLSGQDCIEVRRDFRVPPGVQPTKAPLVETFMWNDRDCNARNYFICERPIVDEPVEKNWSKDCNKTISLTRERPRASLWSPSFPKQYPDNANCYSTVTAPSGYRIVLEFEELVLENEPACSYDYLEITEPSANHHSLNPTKKSDSSSPASSLASLVSSASNSFYMRSSRHGSHHSAPSYRKRTSYDSNLSVNSNSNSNSNNLNSGVTSNTDRINNSNGNFNSVNVNTHSDSVNKEIAQTNYRNLLNIFSNLYKPRTNFLIQTPDYPRGNPLFHTTNRHRDSLPRRMCGDWSSKLKLLRYVSNGSYLGLHFVSDYSHHYGGFKAKVFMENTVSECPDERLKPYNGSCYLFVSYPEVDWWTAQQVCRGIGAQLSSVSSPDEHRFITSSIRNQADYSPQLIYWLGGELANNRQFEWTDDTRMRFQGWLPGQGQFDEMPKEAMCLGLQWKMSPTPMLPSGLYWEAQRCRRVGGYICKKPKQPVDIFHVRNETVTGTEGRLTSPGFPNPYPLNMDYWVRIVAPERHRIIVQFQKIDLESQDECLYDYVSVQNYETIALEPMANPFALTMRTAAEAPNHFLYTEEIADRMQYVRRSRNAENPYTRHNGELMSPDQFAIKLRQRRSSEGYLAWQAKRRLITSAKHVETAAEEGRFSRIPMNRKRRRKKRALHENPLSSEHEVHRSADRKKRSSISVDRVDNAQSFLPYVRWCGTHDTNMSKFDFISASNEIVLNVHSDYSISGLGFAATWKAIDISRCPFQTLTAREGVLLSPNYPHFLLNNLDCTYVIQAPVGRRVWLEFTDFRISEGGVVELDVGYGRFQPYKRVGHLNEGIFVSVGEQIKIQIRTGMKPRGKGFRAIYRTVGPSDAERIINLKSNATGLIYHLNYPQAIPASVEYTQHLVAPLGEVILLELYGVEFSQNGCPDQSILEVYDNYADNNGTRWQLCKYQEHPAIEPENPFPSSSSASSLPSFSSSSAPSSRRTTHSGHTEPQHSPVYITSYLNTLHVRQRTTKESYIGLNATVRVQPDVNYKLKLASGDDLVESCEPNPCQSKGKCITADNNKKRCQCHGHFTGRFCGLTLCELEPCLFGKCELTPISFKCHCQTGYIGLTCEQKQKPCADNPCEGRGECFEKNGGFFCRCHAWWEGNRCERRMMHIPYKPLSDRMLQEPFWLGLITVFVVLAFIGLVWCAKRHFPEKIEKLLAEEADRNRPYGHGHHHHTSLREQLQFTTSIPQTAATTPGAPRSIFNRLGIRKPSILSLSSPNPPGGATARTFSLDDLLRPPPRRSPSPRKKRNNSTPTKKNAAEKKQILQQLVSPAPNPKPKISLGELIQLSENRLKASVAESESDLKETTFSENSASASASTSTTRPLNDPKLEKKVTFARLLSKVSAEMSSGSEMDGVNGTHNSSALSLPTEIQYRASSVPQSPCTNDIRSPHSTSSNQGSDSLSSSDQALTEFGFRNAYARRVRPKVSSADSILAMFRNFPSNTPTSCSSIPISMFISPSTTPTVSSPQDDMPADDESSTSSMHTPVSFSSGPSDSPVFYRQTTIEVPVLDALNAHKSSSNTNVLHPPTILLEIPNNGINKCLSPIREMPTPMPSPALTPIMPRPHRSNSPIGQEDPLSACFSDDDDHSDRQMTPNTLIPTIQIDKNRFESDVSTTPTDTTTTSTADVNRLRGRNNLAPVMITIDINPPSPEGRAARPRDLIIPTLIVEQPSPTRDRERRPHVMHPGSPPPQRASIGETSFAFPSKEQQKRLLKQFEKPTSLDLPFVPPMITITANMSELESDVEPMSPAPSKLLGGASLLVPGNPAMCFLSPFPMCTRADRTISESNLSSSGYSSMASPGPSRCGSSNPLCPNEMDESGSGPPGSGFSLHMSLLSRRQNSLLASCKENVTNGKSSNNSSGVHERLRGRSDSETLSDDALLESNDEGIGTDHLDEKNEEADIKSAKDLEIFINNDLLEVGKTMLNVDEAPTTTMSQLQLPSIVIQGDGSDKLSPVSSRSESPLSERAGMGRFSPHFYGRKDQLPFTDSDGLYDFPSSDGKASSVTHQRRSSSKKRDRKSSKTGQTQSPTRNHLLDLPTKDMVSSTGSHNCCSKPFYHYHSHHTGSITTRKSPKRRPVQRHPVTSSSSSAESLTSARELTLRAAKIASPSRDKYLRRSGDGSGDDTGEDVSSQILPSIHTEDVIRPRKISRLRAIGNQIRFLRRLEKSIKRRERLSPSDSCPEDGNDDGLDSSHVTSPLLQSTSSKPRISICRQKRLPTSIYTANDRGWRSRERNLTHGDINSD